MPTYDLVTLRDALDRLEVSHPTFPGAVRALEAAALYALAVAESDRVSHDDRMNCAHLALRLTSTLKDFRAEIGQPGGGR